MKRRLSERVRFVAPRKARVGARVNSGFQLGIGFGGLYVGRDVDGRRLSVEVDMVVGKVGGRRGRARWMLWGGGRKLEAREPCGVERERLQTGKDKGVRADSLLVVYVYTS